MYDVVIIGGGVCGCSIARELSKYKLNIMLIEKDADVCEGTSKANSGICHAGYDAKTGTLKAKLNVMGSNLMEELSRELGFLYRRCGSLVVCFSDEDIKALEELKERGIKNGVKDIRILNHDEAKKMEPNLSNDVVAALYAPTGAIVDPFGLTVSMADNAVRNGVSFKFGTKVTSIDKIQNGFRIYVHTTQYIGRDNECPLGYYEGRIVINAAGVYADKIHNMISDSKIEIMPRRGEYMLLDSSVKNFVSRTVFQLPTKLGKGVLITPTLHGNILVGPTAEDIENKEDTQTTRDGLSLVKEKALLSACNIPFKEVITSFAGLRARLYGTIEIDNFEKEQMEDDFLIGEVIDAPGFIDVAGIESPGLSASPAIAKYVASLIERHTELVKKEDFIKENPPKFIFADSTDENRKHYIAQNPLYANMICRCCYVTEGEIMDAIHSPIGAVTTDGVKRRVYAGMGRCQAGFCNPKVVRLLARELRCDADSIIKNNEGSNYLV